MKSSNDESTHTANLQKSKMSQNVWVVRVLWTFSFELLMRATRCEADRSVVFEGRNGLEP